MAVAPSTPVSFIAPVPMAMPRRSARLRSALPASGAGARKRARARAAAAAPALRAPRDIEGTCTPPNVLSLLLAGSPPPAFTHPKTQTRPLLDSLVATILSQATTNVNSSRAFAALKRAFPAWEAARAAGAAEIEHAIRSAGLARQKSRVIHDILERVRKRRGTLSLEHLHDLTDEQVKRELCAFKGVGPKTAACVLMFAMRRQEFPVDTHVRRIAGRLGWMPLGASAETTYQVLNERVPPAIKYDLHVALIQHGRTVCGAQRVRCGECPLQAVCPRAGVEDHHKDGDERGGKRVAKGEVNVEVRIRRRDKVEEKEEKVFRPSAVEPIKVEGRVDAALKKENVVPSVKEEQITIDSSSSVARAVKGEQDILDTDQGGRQPKQQEVKREATAAANGTF